MKVWLPVLVMFIPPREWVSRVAALDMSDAAALVIFIPP
jgi:hypothetical protein